MLELDDVNDEYANFEDACKRKHISNCTTKLRPNGIFTILLSFGLAFIMIGVSNQITNNHFHDFVFC